MAPRSIALEEAYNLPSWKEMSEYQARLFTASGDGAQHANRLVDINKERIERMDKHNVEVSILSLTAPGIQDFTDPKEAAAKAREANDWVYEQMKQNPTRFRAFASLSMHDPKEAADELTRCVKELGFVGALVNDNQRAQDGQSIIFYDGPEWDVFWKTCEDLDVPFYLHPIAPKGYIFDQCFKERSWLIGPVMSFKHGVSVHLTGMIVNGVFDRHPKLKVIIGHLGEGQIIDISRASHWLEDRHKPRFRAQGKEIAMKRTLLEYFKSQIWITTSGHFDTKSLQFCIDTIGLDRCMFSIDYPYEHFEDACDWWKGAEKDFSKQDYEAMTRGTAIEVCGLKL